MEKSRYRDFGKISATWNSVFEHNSTAVPKTVFRTYFLISFISYWNFLSWQHRAIIITFWEALYSIVWTFHLNRKGRCWQQLVLPKNSQQIPCCSYGKLREGNALLWLWTVLHSSTLPLVKLTWIVHPPYNLGQKFSFGW